MRAEDRFMESAGFYRDWPVGRGIFFNDSMDIFIWLGEEDLFRIFSLEDDADFNGAFTRLASLHTALEEHFSFSFSDEWGYLNSCPSNVGTGMRASVHIRLPFLAENPSELEKLCSEMQLQIRGTSGEHTKFEQGIYDISNKTRLGSTEYEIVDSFSKSIQQLIQLEKCLSRHKETA